MMSRRQVLLTGSLWLSGLIFRRLGWSDDHKYAVEIYMKSDPAGARVAFDPLGILVRPGQTVRWINAQENVHTTTAYHPSNDRHPLRIPKTAKPWDSGFVMKAGDIYEVQLTVEGIYDYYCKPHEAAGMVGRIVVAESPNSRFNPAGPYPDVPENPDWREVPSTALRRFPAVETIMKNKQVAADLHVE